jgi:hypothetical protein
MVRFEARNEQNFMGDSRMNDSGGVFAKRGEYVSHAKPQRTRSGLNSLAEETSSSESVEDPSQAFFFVFFAASREKNLLSKFALTCGCTHL